MKEKKVKEHSTGNKKKSIKIMMIIFIVLQFLCCGLLIYTIRLISGIENEIRYIGMGVIILVNILLVLLELKFTKKGKLLGYIIFGIITLLLIGGQAFGGYYIYKIYHTIDNISKDNIEYEAQIIVLQDSKILDVDVLNDKKIGIVEDKALIDGYIIGMEIVNELKLDDISTVIEYDSIANLMKDLYDKKIDVAIVSANYASMLKSMENFSNIEKDVKSIYSKSKTLSKKEIAKITGDEITNLNSSNSVTEPFSILVMGIDSTLENLDKNATGNGDALMLVTFNPKTLNATILSIPRDSYVSIPCLGGRDNKITHAAWGGESCMIRAIQNFTGINIDYYVKINFKGVVKLVDVLGGVTVEVPQSLDGVCEQDSNRQFGDSLQCFQAGTHVLNGEQALAMARHRKTLATGDFERGINQQRVVQGILNQLKSIKTASQAMEILNTISSSMDTNFTTKQLLSFYDILKNLLLVSSSDSIFNLQRLELAGSSQMIYDERSGLVLYNFILNQSSLNQVVKVMKQNLGKESSSMVKSMDFDIEDHYEMTSIGKNNLSSTKLFSLLTDYNGWDATDACSAITAKGIKCSIKYIEKTEGTDNIVLSQDVPSNKRIDLIDANGITFEAIKLVKDDETDEDEENNDENPSETEGNGEETPPAEEETDDNDDDPPVDDPPAEEPPIDESSTDPTDE